VTAGADGTARVWDWTGGAVVIAAHDGTARAVALSPDGEVAATLGADAEAGGAPQAHVRLWRWRAGGVGQDPVASAAVGGPVDASQLWGAAWVGADAVALAAGREFTVAAAADPAVQTRLAAPGDALVAGVAASPDGRRIAGTDVGGRLLLWGWPGDAPEGEFASAGEGRTRAVLLPDGSAVTADAAGHVRRWDPGTPTATAERELGSFLSDVAASPDGRTVATAGADGLATILDAATLRPLVVLKGHTGTVKAVALGERDGAPIAATGGADGTVRVWDAAGGRPLVTFRGQQGAVRDVAIAPDGRDVASVADDGSLVAWPCDACGPIDDVRTAAVREVRRELSPLEEDLYIDD
jgi:WD40 repeat protein